METPLLSLHIGRIADLGPDGRRSAIHKPPLPGPLHLTRLGLAGDEQADTKNHGGPDKALHHYPREHYEVWRAELAPQAAGFIPGGFGENLSTHSFTESNVCVGDVFRLGGALVQVSQGRTPCGKLNLRFDVADMVRRVQNTGRTGWYYRVLEPGMVSVGDALTLLERPSGAWPLARVWRLLQQTPIDRGALAALAELEPLAQGWRDKARQRLADSWEGSLQQRLRGMFRG
jgi:MOSC domain-containing protein YiiM